MRDRVSVALSLLDTVVRKTNVHLVDNKLERRVRINALDNIRVTVTAIISKSVCPVFP